jgi:hypothetical protein
MLFPFLFGRFAVGVVGVVALALDAVCTCAWGLGVPVGLWGVFGSGGGVYFVEALGDEGLECILLPCMSV